MDSGYIQDVVSPGQPRDGFRTVTLAQAVHGSSNAPVQFFDDPAAFSYTGWDADGKTGKERLFWDGAVGGNNNPVKSGVLEALTNGVSAGDIKIISIGTANTVQPVKYNEDEEPATKYDWLVRYSGIDCMIEDFERLSTSILSDPPDAASFDAHRILNLPYKQNDERFVRINPLVKPILKKDNNSNTDYWDMPGEKNNWTEKEMSDLFVLDMAVATAYGVGLIDKLCDDFFVDKFDNQGIRLGGRRMEAILGHKTYTEAMADWKKW